mmetsp:Transcript_31767/g.106033  ORF Transcript_31767/g.106033 Transcript_31767/m.106033 type:complete len:475 (-) Transcript_31767:388-1812(-)
MVGDGKGAVTAGGPSGASRSIKLYEKVEQVGEGTYGQVYKARSRESGEIVALKRVRMDNEKEGFPITAIREIKILKVLNHKNIVRLHEIVTSDASDYNHGKGSIYMVMEYCDHDLTGLSDSGHRFSPGQIKCYMKQLLEGLCYCHKNHVLHRDIKGSNLLINESGQLKLADFGLARPFDDQSKAYTNRVITLWYRPPELLLGETHYGPAIDLWSAGCILAELLLRKPILPGRNEFEQLDLVFKLLGTPTEQSWPGVSKLAYFDMMTKQNGGRHYMSRFDDKFAALEPMGKDLLRKLLAMDPSRRITAKEALDHDYFWTPPLPTKPEDLPKYPACHEFTAKKRRQQAAQNVPPAAATQQQPQGATAHWAGAHQRAQHAPSQQQYGGHYQQYGHAAPQYGQPSQQQYGHPSHGPPSFAPGYAGAGYHGGGGVKRGREPYDPTNPRGPQGAPSLPVSRGGPPQHAGRPAGYANGYGR